jgi:hypothetical protein
MSYILHLDACILKTQIKPLLRVCRNYRRRMPLFNNVAIAALVKATSTLATPNTTNGNNAKKNHNRVETNKCKLVKQGVPTGMTVLCLVLPTTEDSYYTDMPNATTVQALEAITEILEQQENLKLVGKQEWMEEWPSKDNPQVPLSGIEKIKGRCLITIFNKASRQWEVAPRKSGILLFRGPPTKVTWSNLQR